MYIARGRDGVFNRAKLVSFCIDDETEKRLQEMASTSPDPVAASLAKVILGSIVEDEEEVDEEDEICRT